MIIATRILKLRRDATHVDVAIRIFAPKQVGDAWTCQYEIDWPEGKETRAAWGIDSVQAIILALQMVGADIYTSNYHKACVLIFESSGQGYGFPVPESLRSLLVGNDLKFF